MEVHLEHDWMHRSYKVWFIERAMDATLYFVPAPGEPGDVWQTVRVEPGAHIDPEVVPLTISDEMASVLRDALNETEMPLRGTDANKVLIDVLRNEGERNNQRVDKMIDALITGNMPQVQHIYTRVAGEEDHG